VEEEYVPAKVAPVELQIKNVKLKVHSAEAADLKSKIEAGLQELEGVMRASYDPHTRFITVMYRPREISLRTLVD